MARRKYDVIRPYPPDFVSAETLAYRLDISETTRADLEAKGFLPPPAPGLDGLKRWWWPDVEARVCGKRLGAEIAPFDDPYIAGMKRGSLS